MVFPPLSSLELGCDSYLLFLFCNTDNQDIVHFFTLVYLWRLRPKVSQDHWTSSAVNDSREGKTPTKTDDLCKFTCETREPLEPLWISCVTFALTVKNHIILFYILAVQHTQFVREMLIDFCFIGRNRDPWQKRRFLLYNVCNSHHFVTETIFTSTMKGVCGCQ